MAAIFFLKLFKNNAIGNWNAIQNQNRPLMSEIETCLVFEPPLYISDNFNAWAEIHQTLWIGTLRTSNFYSILYYNSDIWHLPTIKSSLKQKLLSASTKALKVCSKTIVDNISYINLHKLYGRATPDQMMSYKLALCLLKLYNSNFNSVEFVSINFNQILTSCQTNFITIKNNRTKVGICVL